MQPICAADDKTGADAFTHPGCQHLRQVARGQSLSALVEHQPLRLSWNRRIDAQRFVLEYHIDRLACAVFRLQFDHFNARFWWHASGVFLKTGLHPGRHLVAERNDRQLQVGLAQNVNTPVLADIAGHLYPKRRASARVCRRDLFSTVRGGILNPLQFSGAWPRVSSRRVSLLLAFSPLVSLRQALLQPLSLQQVSLRLVSLPRLSSRPPS